MASKLHLFKKSLDFEPFEKPTYVFSLFIILVVYLFLHIVNIKGTLVSLLYIGSLVPFLVETKQNIITPNNYSSAKKPNINLKIADLLKLKYILLFVIILIYSLSPLYLPDMFINQMSDYSKSQTFNQNINELTEIILLNSTNDYEKTKAIYYWSNISSKNIYGIYSKKPFIQIYPLHLYLTPPYYCIRLIEHQNPEWILSSRCGACEEFSQIFMILADNANLTVRSVHNHGYDHNWDEVFIDGKWIIVDPSMNKFDVPPSYYEDDLNWVSTYVFAIYPNGTKEDITPRYTNLSYLTLRVIDNKMNPISNASVSLFSNNHPKHSEINTTFQTKTNSNGTCLISVGGGNYTLVVEKMINEIPFSNKTKLTILEDEKTTCELTLEEEKYYWINNNQALSLRTVNFIVSFLYSFLLWLVLIMYIELKKIENKKGRRIAL